MSSITYSERIKIETFCELGLSNIQMGVRLNRSPSTISYELSRCQPYQAELAQTDAEYKQSRCGRKTKLSDELKQKILNHLRLSWLPGMIAHEFKLDTVVGPRGHSKAVLLTLIDRKSRFLWAYRLKDRTTATVNEALTKFLTTFNGVLLWTVALSLVG